MVWLSPVRIHDNERKGWEVIEEKRPCFLLEHSERDLLGVDDEAIRFGYRILLRTGSILPCNLYSTSFSFLLVDRDSVSGVPLVGAHTLHLHTRTRAHTPSICAAPSISHRSFPPILCWFLFSLLPLLSCPDLNGLFIIAAGKNFPSIRKEWSWYAEMWRREES